MSVPLRDRMRSGETLVGCFVQTPRRATCEVLARTGFDVLVADAEHAPLSGADVETIVATAEAEGVPALVRIAQNEIPHVQYALDAGAAGVIVPRVESADDATRAVAAARYPPQGSRGAGPGRAARYGMRRAEAVAEALASTLVAVQVETAAAVARVAEICAVPGVDLVFVGPNDLSLSLGGAPDAELRSVIDTVLGVATGHGLLTGILAPTGDLAVRYRKSGVRLLITATDLGLLAAGAREGLRQARRRQCRPVVGAADSLRS
jgi:4-hydroxy-2-oxoheptanedioate aldolase